jgi:hypothetical protein
VKVKNILSLLIQDISETKWLWEFRGNETWSVVSDFAGNLFAKKWRGREKMKIILFDED